MREKETPLLNSKDSLKFRQIFLPIFWLESRLFKVNVKILSQPSWESKLNIFCLFLIQDFGHSAIIQLTLPNIIASNTYLTELLT